MLEIFFKDVLKTTVTHTGTKIQYAMPSKNNCLYSLSNDIMPNIHFDNAKIITFAENSPLKKLRINQALVEYNKQTGVRRFSFWENGRFKMSANNNKEDIDVVKFFLDILRK